MLIFLRKNSQFGLLLPCHNPRRGWFENFPRTFSGSLKIWTHTGHTEKLLDIKRAAPSMFTFSRTSLILISVLPKLHEQSDNQDFLINKRFRFKISFSWGRRLIAIKTDSPSLNDVIAGKISFWTGASMLFEVGRNWGKSLRTSLRAVPVNEFLLATSLKELKNSLVEKLEPSNNSTPASS